MIKKVLALVTCLLLVFSLVPISAFAVTGNHIAADGTYTSKLQGYKKGKAESDYTATLNVVVKNGKFSSLYVTNHSKDKMQEILSAANYSQFLGIDATVAAVKSVSDLDAVSGATKIGLNGDKNAKYSISLVDSLIIALKRSDVYTASVKGQKVKSGRVKETYTATLNAVVDDGKILGIWLTDYKDDKIVKKVFANTGYTAFIDIEATEAAVNAAAKTSAVKNAEAGAELTTSKEYSMNLVQGMLEIVGQVPVPAPETFLTGSASADNNKYQLTVTVGMKDGKISSLSAQDVNANANWSSVVSAALDKLLGKTATEAETLSVDVISSATRYSATFYSAVCNALGTQSTDLSKTLASEPTFVWSDDLSSATVNVSYKNGDTAQYNAEVTRQVKTEATCSAEGSATYTATAHIDTVDGIQVFTSTRTSVLAKLAHSPAEAVRENVTEATCTEDGAYDEVIRCEICGELLESTHHAVEALGHRWGEWTVVKEPTYDEEGLRQRVCENDAAHVETETIARLARTDLSAAVVVLSETKLIYDGTPQSVTASVTLDGLTLVEGTDYTLTGNTQTESGVYTATVHGIGAYEGTVSASWRITKNCTVTSYVNGKIKTSQHEETTSATVRAAAVAGKKFSHWEVDGVRVSTSARYSFIVLRDTEITAVYVDEANEVAEEAVLSLTAGKTTYNGKNAIGFNFTHSIPQGYTVQEIGLLYATNKLVGADTTQAGYATVNLLENQDYGVSDVESALKNNLSGKVKCYVANYINDNGTVKYSYAIGTNVDAYVYAVGYIKVVNAQGEAEILYSNFVATNYNLS